MGKSEGVGVVGVSMVMQVIVIIVTMRSFSVVGDGGSIPYTVSMVIQAMVMMVTMGR